MRIRTAIAGTIAAAAVSLGTVGTAVAAEQPTDHPRLEQLCERLPTITERVHHIETRLNEATTRLQAARAKAEAAGRTELVNRIDGILARISTMQQKVAAFESGKLAKLEAACAKQ